MAAHGGHLAGMESLRTVMTSVHQCASALHAVDRGPAHRHPETQRGASEREVVTQRSSSAAAAPLSTAAPARARCGAS